jgi:hypothetical protein
MPLLGAPLPGRPSLGRVPYASMRVIDSFLNHVAKAGVVAGQLPLRAPSRRCVALPPTPLDSPSAIVPISAPNTRWAASIGPQASRLHWRSI